MRTSRPRSPGPSGDAAGLITRGDAIAAAWSDGAIAHAIAAGGWNRIRRGVYLDRQNTDRTGHDNLRLAARASARCCSRAAISHVASGIEYGLPTLAVPTRPCLTVPAGTALRALADVHLHRATLEATDVVTRDGVRITAPARTVLDIARERGVAAGVVVADAALHAHLVSTDELHAALRQCSGWPGRRAARVTTICADGSAESPLESLSRLKLRAFGLPAPQLQVEIGDEFGQFVARPDFYWPDFGVVGEADGNLKYDAGRKALVAERRREQALEDLGLVVVRWEWRDLVRFEAIVRRLRSAFARGTPSQRATTLHPVRDLRGANCRFSGGAAGAN